MTLLQDVRATLPDLRESMPDLREVLPDLREAMPEARSAMPALRDSMSGLSRGLAEFRNELPPGPWRPDRPSMARRVAIVVVTAGVVVLGTWLLMAFLERRRLAARESASRQDAQAMARAEDEGMGSTIGSSVPTTPPLEPRHEPLDRTPVMATAANGVSAAADVESGGQHRGG